MSTLTQKVNAEQPIPSNSNFLICCYFRLYNNSLLKTICLIDMIFYLMALTFNLTWTLFEVFGNAQALGNKSTILHCLYGTIMVMNVAVLIYAIHFKCNYRKYNMLVRNRYFETYYYLRILWGTISTCIALAIFILLVTTKVDLKEYPNFPKFFRFSNIFSLLYILYSVFCFSSSPGFKKSWYGMLSKDISFYFE